MAARKTDALASLTLCSAPHWQPVRVIYSKALTISRRGHLAGGRPPSPVGDWGGTVWFTKGSHLVAFDISKALGDADGNPVPIGQLFNFSVGGHGANPFPGGTDLSKLFGQAGNIFDKFGGDLKGLEDTFNKVISEALKELQDALKRLEDALGGLGGTFKNVLSDALKGPEDALKRLEDALKGLGDIFKNVLSDALKGPEDALKRLEDALGGLGDTFKNVLSDALKGPEDALKRLEDALKGLEDAVKRALTEVIKTLTNADDKTLDEIYKGFVTLIARAFGEAFKAVIDGVKSAIDGFDDNALNGIANAYKDLVTALRKLFDTILKVLLEALNQFDNLPGPLKCGPNIAVPALGEMIKLLVQVDGDAQVKLEARVKACLGENGSLQQLFLLIVGSGSAKDKFLFGQLFDGLNELLLAAIRGTAPADLWTNFVLQDLIFPKDTILGLVDAITKKQLWFWLNLPCGLETGQLNAWLNDPKTYQVDLELEREFRVRLVAALDAYVRAKLDDPKLATILTEVDATDTPYVVAGLVCVILDTILNFVLEPDCFVAFEADLDGIEDLGFSLGVTLSRQIRLSIRSVVGLLLRGFSFWSVRNEVLIELAGATLGSLFGAMLEGVVRNLTSTLRIVTAYPNAAVGAAVVVDRWDSIETVAGTSDHLQFLLLLRKPLNGQPAPTINLQDLKNVRGLFQDLGAYIDLSYRRYLFENRFPAIADVDTVTIERAEVSGGKLLVTASTTAGTELPQPVLRVYCCCKIVVMRPGSDPSQSYFLELTVPDFPRVKEVTVLSNRGGVTRTRVTRL
jgi:archaellum component FlaC